MMFKHATKENLGFEIQIHTKEASGRGLRNSMELKPLKSEKFEKYQKAMSQNYSFFLFPKGPFGNKVFKMDHNSLEKLEQRSNEDCRTLTRISCGTRINLKKTSTNNAFLLLSPNYPNQPDIQRFFLLLNVTSN